MIILIKLEDMTIFLYNTGNSYLFWAKSLAKGNSEMASKYLTKAKDNFSKCKERMDNIYK